MTEALIEQALRTALCQALGRSFQEAGLPPAVAQELCSRLLTPTPVAEERADAAAAAALDVEDEEDLPANSPAMSVPQEVLVSGSAEDRRAETATVEELMAWLVPALEDGATWADTDRAAGPSNDTDRP
jgi:hypothetical protein